MAEKMFSLTHLISESKLLALISTHADEVRVDIYQPERRPYKPRIQNAEPSPLMLEAPTKKQRAQNNKKSDGGMTGSALTLKYLADHKDRAVANKELLDNINSHGLSVGSVSVAMTGFLRKRYIERTAPGQYKILQAGLDKSAAQQAEQQAAKEGAPAQLDAFGPPSAPKTKQPGVGRGNYDRGNGATVSGRALVWAELVKGEPIKSEPFRKIYEDHKLQSNSVSGAFEAFIAKGLAKRIEPGVFQITKKGLEKHEQETAKT